MDLIYIDPPFATGADFSFIAAVGDETFTKTPSIIEQKAYRDTWGRGLDGYLCWFYETVALLHELLSEEGSIYVHCDWHVNSAIRHVLDEVFGPDRFQSEIIWKRKDANKAGTTLSVVTDTIFFYSKSEKPIWNHPFVPHTEERIQRAYGNTESDGRQYALADLMAPGDRKGTKADYEWNGVRPRAGRHWSYTLEKMQDLEAAGRILWNSRGIPKLKIYLDESKGSPLSNLWADIAMVKGGTEATSYATQKPEALLERIIKASSNEGDLVLDCFCGSGTTAAVAERLGRRWLTCDLGRFAIHTTRKRLLAIENVRPFVVQNLGKYERQVWQRAEFGAEAEAIVDTYRRFILDLYHAEPLAGYTWLHGKKGGRLVHVGTVDTPITAADVQQMAIEFRRLVGAGENLPRQAGIDVLGWDFALELNETARQVAQSAGLSVRFVRIPREVLEKKAVEQGDIAFFELAALAVEATVRRRTVTVALTDFMVPPDDVPADVIKAVKKWSEWIDYWAVDFDYRDDTFHNEWQSYRTRKDRALQLRVTHEYDQPGCYTVVVKAIDILGNDTTKALTVTIPA
ncbi:MAG TPA: DNA methyltransferase [Thermomicrobiales bacterium]|nr:DNA methyltransferase [Thermomicrobiales bacterium]